jgi:predicted PurR-regulated permease PerM
MTRCSCSISLSYPCYCSLSQYYNSSCWQNMPDDGNQLAWFTEHNAFFVLIFLSVFLVVIILLPYLKYVLLAVVLGYVLMPAQRVFEQRIGSMWAAVLLIFVAVLLIIFPVVYILAVAIQEGTELVTAIQEGDFTVTALEDRLAAAGYPMNIDGLYNTYQEPVRTGVEGATTSIFGIVEGGFELAVGLTVTVFVLYSLLYDRERLLAWLRELIPIRDTVQQELLSELDRLMWVSVVSNVAIAVVQTILLGIAVVVAGIPGVVLIAVATFLAALLPLIGVVAVWLPLSMYLVVAGRPIAAALMFIYGVVISTADNYLRAALIGHSGDLSVAIVVVGIFGGIAVFGVVGLFVGPVILGGAKITLETILREQRGGAADIHK